MKSNIFHFTLFAISTVQFATIYSKINWKVFPFCWKISITHYCKTIAILLRNSAILLTYCIIEYCNSAIPQHHCYCFVQYSEKLLAVSLVWVQCYQRSHLMEARELKGCQQFSDLKHDVVQLEQCLEITLLSQEKRFSNVI